MPVHNAGPYLRPAVDSVLAQTFHNFELLVTDDGSRDGCLDSLSGISDERLHISRQEARGAPAALNAALSRARGNLIAFLDHDDLWRPEKLAHHVEFLGSRSDFDLTFDWSRMIDGKGADLGMSSSPWEGSISFEQLVMDFVIGNTSAIVVRQSALREAGLFNEQLSRAYDVDMCWRIAALRPRNCCSVSRQLTFYRRHDGQMSRDWRELQREWHELLALLPRYAGVAVAPILPVADSNMTRYLAALACEQGDRGGALRLALSAFRRAPRHATLDARNWMVLAAAAANALLPRALFEKVMEWGMPRFRRRTDETEPIALYSRIR